MQGLRDGLRARGADLVILRGPLEERLPELAAAVGAQRIVTEDEVEYRHAAVTQNLGPVLCETSGCMHAVAICSKGRDTP